MRIRVACIIIFSVILGCAEAAMEQQAYVWQRSWTPRVEKAIEQHAELLGGLTVLCSEVSFSDGKPRSIQVSPHWDLLKSSGLPISLAIRAGSYSGSFDAEAPMTRVLLGEVSQMLAAARVAGLEPTAVEIDFDCATQRLEGYAEWLRLIRTRLDDVALSITTLPTWMSRPEAFGQLVARTDHFVLQVHSIQRADSIDSEAMLCHPTLTKKWTEQAAGFGKPYHVALPTYAYRLAYDESGELVEVAGENALPIQNPAWRYRVIRAEPKEMSSLVREFEKERPEDCLGVIWYRLPIGEERHNWDALTWRAVMAGRVGGEAWEVKSRLTSEAVVEIELIQNSVIAAEPPRQIIVSLGNGTALAWDGQRNYSVRADQDHGLIWEWPTNMSPPLLAQGTRWTIGWLLMEAPASLKIAIVNHAD